MKQEPNWELSLWGGGLANCLLGLFLSQRRPEFSFELVETQPVLGGNHTWCFHRDSLEAADFELLQPAVIQRWPSQEVRFPGYSRVLKQEYCAVSSAQLNQVVQNTMHKTSSSGSRALSRLHLNRGKPSRGAHLILDGRGMCSEKIERPGFQKFMGLEVECSLRHGVDVPLIMDATVPQSDGYSFVYILPLDEKRLLVEYTFYSLSAALDAENIKGLIFKYVESKLGQMSYRCLRQEQGCLPIPVSPCSDPAKLPLQWQVGSELPVGLRAGLFHPTTGYSIVEAVRFAAWLCRQPLLSAGETYDAIRKHLVEHHRNANYYYLLNKLLFLGADPSKAYKVFERFYGFDEDLILKFYSLRLNGRDKVRLLSGVPPIWPNKHLLQNLTRSVKSQKIGQWEDGENYIS